MISWPTLALEITRPLLNQTVPVGTNVVFEVQYRSDTPVTIEWRHENSVLQSQTNESLIISNVEAGDIGRYTIILTANSVHLTNSAILDIDIPYPPARFTEVTPVSFPPVEQTNYQVLLPYGIFRNGTIPGGFGFVHPPVEGGPGAQWNLTLYGFDSLTGAKLWTNSHFYGPGFSAPAALCITPNDDLIYPYRDAYPYEDLTLRNRLFYYGISPSGGGWTFLPQPEAYFSGFDGDANICFSGGYSTNPFTAFVLSKTGQILVSRSLPGHFMSNGRAFIGAPGNTNLISQLSYQPHSSNSWVFGVIGFSGEIEWISESPQSFYPCSPGAFAKQSLIAFATNSVFKVLSDGQVAWSLTVPTFEKLANMPLNRFGHVVGFFRTTNQLNLGSFTLPASSNDWLFADIDNAGVPRTVSRVKRSGVLLNSTDNRNPPWIASSDFTYDSFGNYHALLRLSTNAVLGDFEIRSATNRYYLVKVKVPEPDPSTPAKPAFTRTVTNSEAITLMGSPDLPGMVLYQWFHDGYLMTSQTQRGLTISAFAFADAGQYSLAIRNAYGSAINPIATLNYAGPPALTVNQQSANELVLRWPISATDYRVESASDLLGGFSPTNLTITTNTAAARFEIRLPISGNQKFYRLHHP